MIADIPIVIFNVGIQINGVWIKYYATYGKQKIIIKGRGIVWNISL